MITINADISKAKEGLTKYFNYFNKGGVTKTLEKVGEFEYDEHLKRFDTYKVDYKGNPLLGLTEEYYKWKVRYTGNRDQNIGILSGKMRASLFYRVLGNTLYVENFVKSSKGHSYAHHFQKRRAIFGFADWEVRKSKEMFIHDLKKV